MYKRIIFVCTGNTCRSPMAETLLKSLINNKRIEILSRGIVVLFPEPVNPKAEAVLNNHNLTMEEHMAKQLTGDDISGDTLLLGMTGVHVKRILHNFPDANVITIKEFVGEIGDVTDPYGGSLVEYEECYSELVRLVKKAAYILD